MGIAGGILGSRHGGWQCAEDVHVLMADLLLLLLFPLYSLLHLRAEDTLCTILYRSTLLSFQSGKLLTSVNIFHFIFIYFIFEEPDEELDTYVPFSS